MTQIHKPDYSALGRKGGLSGRGKAKARTSEQARAAIRARWDRVRAASAKSA
jgi:hypothetical protein